MPQNKVQIMPSSETSHDEESFHSNSEDTNSLISTSEYTESLTSEGQDVDLYLSENDNISVYETDSSLEENTSFAIRNLDVVTNNDNNDLPTDITNTTTFASSNQDIVTNNNNDLHTNITNKKSKKVVSAYTYMRNNPVSVDILKKRVKGLLNALYRDITIAEIQTKVENELSEKKIAIYNYMLSTLDKVNDEQTELDILFDLYFVINSIFNICKNPEIKDIIDLIEVVQRFLGARGKILYGDEHDYNHNIHIAPNVFCEQLIGIICPKAVVNNLLVFTSLQREKKWLNPFTSATDLPALKDFFRTPECRIQLYEAIVSQAISALKMQCDRLEDIWFSTDNIDTDKAKAAASDASDVKVGNTKIPLSKYEIAIVRDRSPALEQLVQYSEYLQKMCSEKKTIYSRLNDLRLALKAGEVKKFEHDQTRSGTDKEAGPEAGDGSMGFADWWSRLPLIPGGKEIQDQISAIQVDDEVFGESHYQEFRTLGGRLNYILNPLPDPSREKDMRYCVQKQGEMLEELLEHATVQAAIAKIDNTANLYWNHEYIDLVQSQIQEELRSDKFQIKTDKNYFRMLAHLPGFVDGCVMAYEAEKGLDYFHLANIADWKIMSSVNHYRYFDPGHLGKILVQLIQSGNFLGAKLILEMKPEVLKLCHKDVFLALFHVIQTKPLDLELVALLANAEGIYAMRDDNGRDLLAFALLQFPKKPNNVCISIRKIFGTNENIKILDDIIKNNKERISIFVEENKMLDIAIENSLKKLFPTELVYRLKALIMLDISKENSWQKSFPVDLVCGLKALIMLDIIIENSLQKSLPADLIYGMEALIKVGEIQRASIILKAHPELIGVKVIYVGENNASVSLTMLDNAVLNDDHEIIDFLMDIHNIKLYSNNQIKAVISNVITGHKQKIIRAFLDLVDDENYKEIFNDRLVCFIITQLTEKKQFDMAHMFLQKRDKCLGSLSPEQRDLLYKAVAPECVAYRKLILSISKSITEDNRKKSEAYKKEARKTKKSSSILSNIFQPKKEPKESAKPESPPKPPV